MSSLTFPAKPFGGGNSSPVPPPVALPDPDAALSGSQRTAFLCLSVYVFLMMSRMPEFIALRFGTSFYQVFIVSILCGLMLFLGADLRRFVQNRLTAFMIGLHFLYLLSIPFSYWKTGSIEHLKTVGRYLPLFIFLTALIHTEKQLRKLFVVMCVAMLLVLVYTMAAPVQETDDDRLVLNGRFANSNEIALYLLIGLPFWLYLATSKRFPAAIRILAGLEIGLSLFQCLRTGSRGGLITIALIGIIIFLVSSMANKVKLMFLVAVISALALPLLPERVQQRFSSIVDASRDASAADSADSRLSLLLQSIRITAMHPMLGVGFGVYPDAAAAISARTGERRRWQVSHNAFTQVSSETGIPAMLLFLGTLFYTWRTLSRAKLLSSSIPEMADLALMSRCITLILLIYLVNCLFANIAQELFYYMICGISMACGAIVEQRYQSLRRAARSEMPLPANAGTSNLLTDTQPSPLASPGSGHTRDPQGRFRPTKDLPPTGGSEQYGNVPWARNPRNTSSGN
jgi:O-antigen ligase